MFQSKLAYVDLFCTQSVAISLTGSQPAGHRTILEGPGFNFEDFRQRFPICGKRFSCSISVKNTKIWTWKKSISTENLRVGPRNIFQIKNEPRVQKRLRTPSLYSLNNRKWNGNTLEPSTLLRFFNSKIKDNAEG